jgi:hypothetical protein
MTGSTLTTLAANSALFYRKIIRSSSFREYFLLKIIFLLKPLMKHKYNLPLTDEQWAKLEPIDLPLKSSAPMPLCSLLQITLYLIA